MGSSAGVATNVVSSVQEIANTLGEVTGKDPASILSQMAANPTHDLAIPSPQAMAILGKLKAKYGLHITYHDIAKTKKGSSCSILLLANLVDNKKK